MLGDVPDDTQDVPQGVLTGVLLAGERAGEASGQKPMTRCCPRSAFLPDSSTGGRRAARPTSQAGERNSTSRTQTIKA